MHGRMGAAAVVECGGAVALSRIARPEREVPEIVPGVFHRKTVSLAQKALTDNNRGGYDSVQVTKTVINGVWEWVSPRFAVWLVAC